MKIIILLLTIFLSVTLLAQQNKTVYWVENNLQLKYRKGITINNHDEVDFSVSTESFQLSLYKLDHLFLDTYEMEQTLLMILKNKGYTEYGKGNTFYKNFMYKVYYQVQKEGYWGVFFMLKEILNGDNCFLGIITTATKPSKDVLKMIENIEVIEEGTLVLEEEVINNENSERKTAEIQTELMSLIQHYSPEIYSYASSYYKLSNELDNEKLFDHYLIGEAFLDSIPYRLLYRQTQFIDNLFYMMCNHLSMLSETEKKESGNGLFSLFINPENRLSIEKLQTSAASIVNNTFPSAYKNELYKDCIFPSGLNRNTQINGIYGLLKEFMSACYEIQFYNDFLQYYYDNNLDSAAFCLDYLHHFPTFSLDGLSYKHYLVNYLMAISTDMPDLYKKIKSDAGLVKIITTYFDKLDHEIEVFNSHKLKIRNEFGNQYIPFIEDDTKFQIDQLQYKENNGLLLYNKQVDYINNSTEYQQIYQDFGLGKGQRILMITE